MSQSLAKRVRSFMSKTMTCYHCKRKRRPNQLMTTDAYTSICIDEQSCIDSRVKREQSKTKQYRI